MHSYSKEQLILIGKCVLLSPLFILLSMNDKVPGNHLVMISHDWTPYPNPYPAEARPGHPHPDPLVISSAPHNSHHFAPLPVPVSEILKPAVPEKVWDFRSQH